MVPEWALSASVRVLLLVTSCALFATYVIEAIKDYKRGLIPLNKLHWYAIRNLDRLGLISVILWAYTGLLYNTSNVYRNVWLGVTLSVIFGVSAIWRAHGIRKKKKKEKDVKATAI